MSCDCEQTECWECYPHYEDHIPLKFDSVRELIVGYEKLEQEVEHLKSQLALCVDALEKYKYISAPSIQNMVNGIFMTSGDCVNYAKECLDKLAAMQSEGGI